MEAKQSVLVNSKSIELDLMEKKSRLRKQSDHSEITFHFYEEHSKTLTLVQLMSQTSKERPST